MSIKKLFRNIKRRINSWQLANKQKTELQNIVDSNSYPSNNPLAGKSVLLFGDSILNSRSANNGIGIKELLKKQYGMIAEGYAQSGSIITNDPDFNWIITKVNEAIANGEQADYVVWNGGTNDASNIDITNAGVITEGYTDSLDKTTFCGAFEDVCRTLINTWVDAKIIYVRAHEMNSRDDRQETYGDLALEICKKYSIPYVDLFNDGDLNTKIVDMRNAYTTREDGTHPNVEGLNMFYVPMITSEMKAT